MSAAELAIWFSGAPRRRLRRVCYLLVRLYQLLDKYLRASSMCLIKLLVSALLIFSENIYFFFWIQ